MCSCGALYPTDLRFFTLWRIYSHSYILCCEKQWQKTAFLLHAPGDLYQLSQLMKSVLFLLSSQGNYLFYFLSSLLIFSISFFNLYLRRPELHVILTMQVYQTFCQLYWSKLPLLFFFFFSFSFFLFYFTFLISLPCLSSSPTSTFSKPHLLDKHSEQWRV